ncbi:hypothetical protein BDW74DRAFT_7203 [Aspergillus multicolor]|uniref:uncharacterized protein n=1 Tax=Aspergillus multicolor TaxID=41759 RepID=UPI003CCDF489
MRPEIAEMVPIALAANMLVCSRNTSKNPTHSVSGPREHRMFQHQWPISGLSNAHLQMVLPSHRLLLLLYDAAGLGIQGLCICLSERLAAVSSSSTSLIHCSDIAMIPMISTTRSLALLSACIMIPCGLRPRVVRCVPTMLGDTEPRFPMEEHSKSVSSIMIQDRTWPILRSRWSK